MSWIRRRLTIPLLARREGVRYGRHLAPLRRELELAADPESRERLQVERTAAVLAHAYAHCPFYREFYDAHGFHPSSFRDLRDLARVPVFEKRHIPGNQERIRARNIPREQLVPTATGGTTGNSFTFWYDRDCIDRRHALTLIANEAYGWRPGDRVAYVWNAHQDLPPDQVSWKARLRLLLEGPTLSIEAARIDEERLAAWARRLRETRMEILYGYAHSLKAIAEYCAAERIELPAVRLVVSTAEPLFDADRRLMQEVFRCPVRDRYLSREHGPMAQEDADGVLRAFADSMVIETTAPAGEAGDVLVTDFWNLAFPFIRYRNGDTCVLPAADAGERGLPRLGRLTGRQTDFLVAADGSRVSGMSFHEAYINHDTGTFGTDDFLAIQFVQQAARQVLVRYVPGPTCERERVRAGLARVVRHLLGTEMGVGFEEVEEIARTASGKYRFTVNAMD